MNIYRTYIFKRLDGDPVRTVDRFAGDRVHRFRGNTDAPDASPLFCLMDNPYHRCMCGRYVLTVSARGLASAFDAETSGMPERMEAYNVAPGSMMPIVMSQDEADVASDLQSDGSPPEDGREAAMRTVRMHRWGLIPHWAKDAGHAYSMINARSEGLDVKPSFRDAFRRRRCVVPANGFYEWTGAPSNRQPHYIHPLPSSRFVIPMGVRNGGTRADVAQADVAQADVARADVARPDVARADAPLPLLAFAGLYERWRSPDGSMLPTFTIITTAAGRDVERIHDRMPAILLPEEVEFWLDRSVTDPNRLRELLHPSPERTLAADQVSRAVNDARHQGASLIEPSGLFGHWNM